MQRQVSSRKISKDKKEIFEIVKSWDKREHATHPTVPQEVYNGIL